MAQVKTKKTSALLGTTKKVGFLGLAAFVVSATIGGGIFSLPASIAQRAGAGATLIAWIITGLGMYMVVQTLSILSLKKPNLKNGVYAYAESGFGKLMGFLATFGYWAAGSAAMASYGILLTSTFSPLVPAFGEGNTWAAFIAISVVIWLIYLLGRRGIKRTAILNTIGTIAKFIPIACFVVVLIIAFKPNLFFDNFWGETTRQSFVMGARTGTDAAVVDASGFALSGAATQAPATPVAAQIMNVMLLTLWVFVGIESAVVVSRDAVNQKTVAKATAVGFFISLALYVLVSLLPFGIMDESALQVLATPSTGYLLSFLIGNTGLILISAGIVISILFAWLVWSVLQATMPTSCAENGSFPKIFAKRNRYGAPEASLIASAVFVELFVLCAVIFGDAAWQKMVSLTSTIAGPIYLLTCLYLVKLCLTEKDLWQAHPKKRIAAFCVGLVGVLFTIGILVASGPFHLFLYAALLSASLLLYFWGTKKATGHIQLLFYEKIIVIVLLGISFVGCLAWAWGVLV